MIEFTRLAMVPFIICALVNSVHSQRPEQRLEMIVPGNVALEYVYTDPIPLPDFLSKDLCLQDLAAPFLLVQLRFDLYSNNYSDRLFQRIDVFVSHRF